MRPHRTSRTLLVTSLCAAIALPGCAAYSRRKLDVDRTPVTNMGAGASVIYPGQTVPMPPPGPVTREASSRGGSSRGATPQAGAPGSGSNGESGPPGVASGGSLTYLGGAEANEKGHFEAEESPLWWKPLTFPFVIAAAPFVWVAKQIRGEPAPETPGNAPPSPPPAPPAPPPVDYETARLQAMERELDQRQARPDTTPGTPSSSKPGSRSLSIAEELAALRSPPLPPHAQQEPEPAQAGAVRAQAAAGEPPPTSRTRQTEGRVDRNGDGVTDHWIYRENGAIVREVFDVDFDGRPDRTIFHDPATHEVARVEEDSNGDGSVDTWSEYRAGQLVRRRADSDADGKVDTWTFYENGELTRHEHDSNGDGQRDQVGYYAGGSLVREESDRDGDGRPDLIVHYDRQERVSRREEDVDGDGRVDVISYYDGGQLARRELLDAEAFQRARRATP